HFVEAGDLPLSLRFSQRGVVANDREVAGEHAVDRLAVRLPETEAAELEERHAFEPGFNQLKQLRLRFELRKIIALRLRKTRKKALTIDFKPLGGLQPERDFNFLELHRLEARRRHEIVAEIEKIER